jgi:hypothetical protein
MRIFGTITLAEKFEWPSSQLLALINEIDEQKRDSLTHSIDVNP